MKVEQLIRKSLARAAITVGLGLGALGSAQAGLVTGNVDPPFGAVLPGVSYQYDFSFSVADSCIGNAPGQVTRNLDGSGGCNAVPVNINFRIYSTAGGILGGYQSKSLSLDVLQMTVVDGFVMGISTNIAGADFFNDFAGGTIAPGKLFNFASLGLYFMPYIQVGTSCGFGCINLDGVADTDGAVATIYNYMLSEDGEGMESKLGYDSNGRPVGYRVTRSYHDGLPVDNVQRTDAPAHQVPVPGSLALSALGLLILAARRRTQA